MNDEFPFWCGHPLVPLLFHEVTSLHPPSFQRNDNSTCNYNVGLCIATGGSVFAQDRC